MELCSVTVPPFVNGSTQRHSKPGSAGSSALATLAFVLKLST